HNADLKVYKHVLRQWCTVEAALGKKNPRSVSAIIKKLTALKKTANYGIEILALLKKYSVRCARDVAKLRLKDKQLQNYCMEILLGVEHEINISPRQSSKESASKTQLKGYTLLVNSKVYNSHIYPMLPMTSKSANPLPELVSQGTLSIRDQRGRAIKGLQTIKLDDNKRRQEFTIPEMPGNDKLYAYFSYKCGGVNIKYKRELLIKEQEHLRKLWIRGIKKDTAKGWALDFILPNKIVYNGSFFDKGNVFSDKKGKLLPIRHATWGRSGESFIPLSLPLTNGTLAKFLVSTGHLHEGRIHEVRFADPLRSTIKNISFTLKKGKCTEGHFKDMSDYDPATFAKLASDYDGNLELEFSCKTTSITNFYHMADYKPKGGMAFKMEYYHKGSWKTFLWGTLRGVQGFHPSHSSPEASKFRMSINADEAFTIDMRELHFLKANQ
ncbi:MAG: hypothetical protein HRT88_22660, partial [Lentisphaeraceae bacterium]|nr:hypothetical protein [Lentisphaeraceae bacterium]